MGMTTLTGTLTCTYEAEAENITSEDIINDILNTVEVPQEDLPNAINKLSREKAQVKLDNHCDCKRDIQESKED